MYVRVVVASGISSSEGAPIACTLTTVRSSCRVSGTWAVRKVYAGITTLPATIGDRLWTQEKHTLCVNAMASTRLRVLRGSFSRCTERRGNNVTGTLTTTVVEVGFGWRWLAAIFRVTRGGGCPGVSQHNQGHHCNNGSRVAGHGLAWTWK